MVYIFLGGLIFNAKLKFKFIFNSVYYIDTEINVVRDGILLRFIVFFLLLLFFFKKTNFFFK